MVTSGLQLTVEIVEVMEARWGEAMLADPSVNPVWHMGNVAFTFLSAPSQLRILAHIRRCAQ
jgi:O-antigen biosynthesis protein